MDCPAHAYGLTAWHPASFRVLASSLARHMSRPSLMAGGLAGSPDALICERAEGTIIVGEALPWI